MPPTHPVLDRRMMHLRFSERTVGAPWRARLHVNQARSSCRRVLQGPPTADQLSQRLEFAGASNCMGGGVGIPKFQIPNS